MNFLVFRPKRPGLANLQINYITISINEDHLWKDLIPKSSDKPQLVRISFDEQAHAGIRLHEMPAMLQNLLTGTFRSSRSLQVRKRTLVMTRSWVSFTSKGLSHGGPLQQSFSGLIGFSGRCMLFQFKLYIFRMKGYTENG